MATTPVLEAFGNAKTAMNDNSSRFGKFLVLAFDEACTVHGARVEDFLLEKSRVVACSPKERNYHAFYQLCATADLKERFGLKDATAHGYLNQHETEVPGGDDAADEFGDED